MNEKPGIKLEEDNPKKTVLGCLLPILIEGGIPLLIVLIYLLLKNLF